jgi:hypothetical protein
MAAAVSQVLARVAPHRVIRFGVGVSTAIVTERVLCVATDKPSSLVNWVAGSAIGGATWGFIGECCSAVWEELFGGVRGDSSTRRLLLEEERCDTPPLLSVPCVSYPSCSMGCIMLFLNEGLWVNLVVALWWGKEGACDITDATTRHISPSSLLPLPPPPSGTEVLTGAALGSMYGIGTLGMYFWLSSLAK